MEDHIGDRPEDEHAFSEAVAGDAADRADQERRLLQLLHDCALLRDEKVCPGTPAPS